MTSHEQHEWARVCAEAEMAPGDVRAVTVGGVRIAVIRLTDRYCALADVCTHEEAYLSEGRVDADDGVIECPKHGAVFDAVTGEALSPPAVVAAPVYQVVVADDEVRVSPGVGPASP